MRVKNSQSSESDFQCHSTFYVKTLNSQTSVKVLVITHALCVAYALDIVSDLSARLSPSLLNKSSVRELCVCEGLAKPRRIDIKVRV